MSGWGSIYDCMMAGLRTHSQTLVSLQERIATGARILRASDGPSDAFEVMSLQSQGRSLEVYAKNIDRALADTGQSNSNLGSMLDLLGRVRTLLTQAASGTYTQAQRRINGEAVDQLLEEAVWLANSKVMGQYIFSGDSVHTRPYSVVRVDDGITEVTYQGSSTGLRTPIAPGVEHVNKPSGDAVFRSDARQAPVFLGQTGAVSGSGTSTIRGDTWLTLTHVATAYAGTTGVAAGASSATGDTILGTSHTLTIDADTKRVRLDDGQFVGYGAGDISDLRLENGTGDAAYIDLTGLDAGLVGTTQVAITATGKMSVDDMDSSVNLTTFADNQAVTDSGTGRVLYVNTTNIARVGTEAVRVPGTYDLFGTLIHIRDLLINSRGLSDEEQSRMLAGGALEAIDEVSSGLSAKLAFSGGRLQAMDTLQQSMEDIKIAVDARRAALQDADITQLATNLARTQALYEMSLAAAGKVMGISLLDYI